MVQHNGKMIKKELLEKYCSACNREMSSRHYYEFHMLNVLIFKLILLNSFLGS
jgi:hypothetical protein